MTGQEKAPETEVSRHGTISLLAGWPSLARILIASMTFYGSWAGVNIVHVSNIMWPGESFHSVEIGIGMGIAFFAFALSPMIFGHLSDRHSRVRLLSMTSIAQGIVIIFMLFTPEGQGAAAWVFFIALGSISNLLSGCCFPVGDSYVSDAIPEQRLSQYYGLQGLLVGVFTYLMMLLSSVLFAIQWRIYLLVAAVSLVATGFVIIVKAKEPVRGAMRQELKSAVEDGGVYSFKLDRATLKSVVMSRSNMIMYIEGFFTQIVLGVPNFLIYIYLQSPPSNLTSWTNAMIGFIASFPGHIFALIVFARLSDKYGARSMKKRIYLIITGLALFILMYMVFVLVPLEPLTPAEGGALGIVFARPGYVGITAVWFGATAIGGLYNHNQRPIVQAANLPETQGMAASVNTFLEVFGSGMGITFGGIVFALYGSNMQLTTITLCLIGFAGTLLWAACFKSLDGDLAKVSRLLEQRATLMKKG
ncbi:MAG: MFS transporter [Candidatus Lokiarchaeota archaeon]|nr:MFS transporter [Candidatus Lokiarchaeota archaeon]